MYQTITTTCRSPDLNDTSFDKLSLSTTKMATTVDSNPTASFVSPALEDTHFVELQKMKEEHVSRLLEGAMDAMETRYGCNAASV